MKAKTYNNHHFKKGDLVSVTDSYLIFHPEFRGKCEIIYEYSFGYEIEKNGRTAAVKFNDIRPRDFQDYKEVIDRSIGS